MKQLRTWSQRLLNEDVIGRVLLEARANQVPHIFGYRIDVALAPAANWNDTGERMEVVVMLQANPLAPIAPMNMATESMDTLIKHRGNIGVLLSSWEPRGGTTVADFLVDGQLTTGWMPCDFPVPGLWMVGSTSSFGHTTPATVLFHVLFDWVSMSPLQVAALYTTYGIDAVDATEREVSGEIDFSQQPGDGSRPGIIG